MAFIFETLHVIHLLIALAVRFVNRFGFGLKTSPIIQMEFIRIFCGLLRLFGISQKISLETPSSIAFDFLKEIFLKVP